MGPSMIIFLIILILIVIFGYIFLVHLEVGVGNLFLIYIENIDTINIEAIFLKVATIGQFDSCAATSDRKYKIKERFLFFVQKREFMLRLICFILFNCF